jgi:putative flippase GtrA
VQKTPAGVLSWVRSDEGVKAVKYTATSVISTITSQAAFILVYGVFGILTSRGSSIVASIAGTIPSYWLNRNWAWGKSGRSHFWREVAPFWIIAAIGLVFSTWGVDFTKTHTSGIHDHTLRTIELAGAYLGSFGLLWVGKFIIFNRFLFVDHGANREDLAISAPPTPPLDDFHPHHHDQAPDNDNSSRSSTPSTPSRSKGV